MTGTDFAAMPWDDSGFHSIGRLPMHGLRRAAEVDLDGEWDFQLRAGLTRPGQDWTPVHVPELWTMREAADRPHYTNIVMPFDEVPPRIPAHNPVGIYRRAFELAAFDGRRVILRVGAAEGLLRVFVNGRPVGISTDSHLAAEFDVTAACLPGQNTIELAIAKWSSMSYIEDQDQWWQSGLSRSVGLYTVPETRLADLKAVADFDPATRTGSLDLTVLTAGLAHVTEPGWEVRVRLLDEEHTVPVAVRTATPSLPPLTDERSQRPSPLLPPDTMDLLSLKAAAAPIPAPLAGLADRFEQSMRPRPLAGTAQLALTSLAVVPWSAESPVLTDLTVTLVSPQGETVDTTSIRLGFRRVLVEGRDLLVNGGRILVQGVNRHDFDPRTGRVVSAERMRAELALLKRFNVNAIRTSHYPNDPVFLDLCDEFGFYVTDEADIEAHGFASRICQDPTYLPAIVERVSRMVLRDRNHPSVIVWSLGNETGYGPNHDAAAGWLRHFDPTRPVHYEAAIAFDWYGAHAATDLVCPMYPGFEALAAYSADPRGDRPLIMCEYAYSQGNATGGLADYWELIENSPGLQGGYIWEMHDHGLDPEGDGRYRYGGDFGDEPNDGVVCINGVVFPDLTPKPALYEARGLFSPVRLVSDAAAAFAGRLRLRNRQIFNDLGAYSLELHVDAADGPTDPVALPTPSVAPGAEADVVIPAALRERLAAGSALAVTVTVRTAQPTGWADAGTVVAVHQVTLPQPEVTAPDVTAGAPGHVPVDAEGRLTHPLLREAPTLALWRALTDCDQSFLLDQRFVRSGFFRLTPTSTQVDKDGDYTVVTTLLTAAFGDEVTHRRTITALGNEHYRIVEHVSLPTGTTDGLRVGIRFELAEGFTDAEWVGLGPWENYPDRRTSALLGRWQRPIDELALPYIRPQENGGRGDVRALRLTGPAGEVITTHPVPVQMNVARNTVDDLEAAKHWWELPDRETTTVHLDIAHRGVGTGALGPDTRPRHRLTGHTYTWTWELHLHAI